MRLLLYIRDGGTVCGRRGRAARQPGKRLGPPPANGMIERLNSMTPEQRKRALDRLPPERRERVQRRLENYNRSPQEEKDRLREQYREFQKLPVEKQDAIRRSFRQLTRASSRPPADGAPRSDALAAAYAGGARVADG